MVNVVHAVLAVVAAPLAAITMHPIHAARVELVAASGGDVVATIRVYEEDFAPGRDHPAISAYLDRQVILTASNGSRVLLRPVATTREGDRLRIMLVGWSRAPLQGGQLQVTLLQEKFADQVNVVEVKNGSSKQQLVSTSGATVHNASIELGAAVATAVGPGIGGLGCVQPFTVGRLQRGPPADMPRYGPTPPWRAMLTLSPRAAVRTESRILSTAQNLQQASTG